MRRFMAEQVLLSRLGRHLLLEPAFVLEDHGGGGKGC